MIFMKGTPEVIDMCTMDRIGGVGEEGVGEEGCGRRVRVWGGEGCE